MIGRFVRPVTFVTDRLKSLKINCRSNRRLTGVFITAFAKVSPDALVFAPIS